MDANENVYFTETINPALTPEVRKVDSHGIISRVAGGGLSLNDGIPATQAAMLPLAVAVDGNGNLYIIDSFGMGIRKVDSKGIITTVAGGHQIFGFAGDGGPALNAQFAFEAFPSIAVDSGGNIYVDDEANERVRKITPAGIINTVAGNGRFRLSGNGGPAASATLDYPLSVTGDSSGNLYISEQLQNRIRRITPDGTISIYAGNGQQGFRGDGGPANSASIAFPGYLTIAPNGALFFSDTVNCRIRYIDHNGNINTYAGGGGCSDSGDGGPANQAGLRAPMGIDIDPSGDLVIAEPQSHRLRVVLAPPDFRIATLAGNGTAGYSGDNGPAPQALVNGPVGVRYHEGFFYFCDTGNHVVRKIDLNTLTISTVAGNGKSGFRRWGTGYIRMAQQSAEHQFRCCRQYVYRGSVEPSDPHGNAGGNHQHIRGIHGGEDRERRGSRYQRGPGRAIRCLHRPERNRILHRRVLQSRAGGAGESANVPGVARLARIHRARGFGPDDARDRPDWLHSGDPVHAGGEFQRMAAGCARERLDAGQPGDHRGSIQARGRTAFRQHHHYRAQRAPCLRKPSM